jgi:hypothetical protein
MNGSWHSVVGIATSYGLDDGGVGVQVPTAMLEPLVVKEDQMLKVRYVTSKEEVP